LIKVNKKYKIDITDKKSIDVPDEIAYQIIQDHLSKSYYWSIGIAMSIIGFLLGVVVS
jgi:hypothetical protein